MARKKYQQIDLEKVKTVPISTRLNKVKIADFAAVGTAGISFADFIENLPEQLAAVDFGALVDSIVEARLRENPVIWGLGAHVIKCGLSPLVIDLMRRGVVTAVAMNGAGAIHDVEIALIGETSEDVAGGLGDGSFGMAEETGRFINSAVNQGQRSAGMGELIGKKLLKSGAPYCRYSILAAGAEVGVPVTIHVAIGTDIVHMQPSAQGAATGNATFNDFRLLASIVADMGHGGVFVNIGSAVILPEVFLKALTVARNLGHDVTDFTTANLDMQQHYRPRQNVLARPSSLGGRSYALTGHHELLLPLLVQALIEKLNQPGISKS